MDGMTGDHMHGMAPPPANTTAAMGGGMQMGHHHKMMMHMTFFWGKNTEILFPGWPGTDSGMYVLALVFVFVLSVLVEWLSHTSIFVREGSNRVTTGLIRTLVHLIRVGLAYMVMLAVMSFNVGVFLVAVVGHALGFLLFCSGIFGNSSSSTDANRKTTTHHVSGMGC